MAMENSVSSNFLSMFINSIDVFDCSLPSVIIETCELSINIVSDYIMSIRTMCTVNLEPSINIKIYTHYELGLVVRKPVSGYPSRPYPNQPAQLQRLARKFNLPLNI